MGSHRVGHDWSDLAAASWQKGRSQSRTSFQRVHYCEPGRHPKRSQQASVGMLECFIWLLFFLLRSQQRPTSFDSNQHISQGFSWWLCGKESAYHCRGHGFDPWSRKIPNITDQQSLCATPSSLCPRAQEPQLLSPWAVTTEPSRPRACALQKRGQCSEKPAQQRRSNTAKINKLVQNN